MNRVDAWRMIQRRASGLGMGTAWPMRLSGTVYCHKLGLEALDALRQRWMVAGWTLKVRATSLMDLPSWTSERARVF